MSARKDAPSPGMGNDARDARRRRGHLARHLGRRGERVAARRLRRRGYRIHARNLRTPCGEIDLLAEEGGCYVVVEVKTTGRVGDVPERPPLGHAQRRRLCAAARWLRGHPGLRRLPIRHDLAWVTLDGRRWVVTIRRDVLRS